MINNFNVFNKKNIQITEKIENLSKYDTNGGISDDEFSDILRNISELYSRRSDLTDNEKILTEILYNILTKPERGYNYDTYYHRRMGFIKNNKKENK